MLALLTLIKAVLSAVWKAILLVCKIVYGILKFLKIRLLALWLAVSGILALCGVFRRAGIGWFWAGVGVAAACTLIAWFLTVRAAFKRKRVPRPSPSEEEEEPDEPEQPAKEPEPAPEKREPERVRYPRWFDVKGRADYCFAEYEDRYELYFRGERGLELVRTDRKGDIR